MTPLEQKLQDLLNRYGLEGLLEEKDIDELFVMELLYDRGLIEFEEEDEYE